MIVAWKHKKRYGQEKSYILGMKWLERCSLVEDWGCGPAYAKRYREGDYRGIDGSPGFADRVADLSIYKSMVPGLFMRGVLEHNHDWRQILQNALESFTDRMFLMLYRPLQDREKVISHSRPTELDLPAEELFRMVRPTLRRVEAVTGSAHDYETLIYLER